MNKINKEKLARNILKIVSYYDKKEKRYYGHSAGIDKEVAEKLAIEEINKFEGED